MTGQARYLEADRSQLSWDMVDLESQLPAEHRARVVWAFVCGLDLSALYARIGSREGEPGRPPPDPRIFLALWLYGTLEGVGSARHLDRLCGSDVAYRWIRGGVGMNYHDLSDFRVEHGDVLDGLLTESLTALLAEGIVRVEEIALDGTKVRASAGRGSFRTGEKLAGLESQARARVEELRGQGDAGARDRRRQGAKQRGSEEVARRAGEAMRALEKLRAENEARAKKHKAEEAKKTEVKASLSDPEARLMRFSDGAVRAGYNVQLAVMPGTGLILAAMTTDRRNDSGMAGSMLDQIKSRLGRLPERVLVDTRYATREDIVDLAAQEVEVYMPAPPDKEDATPESQRKRAKQREREPEAVKAWRRRMAEEESKPIYRRRSWIETVNGILKGRGLAIMQVRSMVKVAAVVLMQALAHNLWRAHCLRSAPT